jgi:hypothetical protein
VRQPCLAVKLKDLLLLRSPDNELSGPPAEASLFKSNLSVKKYGVIGQFGERPKKKLWSEIREREQRIAEGLESPNVRESARHVYAMLGETVPLKRIERSFALRAQTTGGQEWIASLFGDGDGET